MGQGIKMLPNTSVINNSGKSAYDMKVGSYHSTEKIEGENAINLFNREYHKDYTLYLETLTTTTCLTLRDIDGNPQTSATIQNYSEYGNHVDVYKITYNTGFVKYAIDNSAGLRQAYYFRMFRIDWENLKITWGTAYNICPASSANTRRHIVLLAGINCGIVPLDFMYLMILEDLSIYPDETESYKRKRTYHYNYLYLNPVNLTVSWANSNSSPTLTNIGDTSGYDFNIEDRLDTDWFDGNIILAENWNLSMEKAFAYIGRKLYDTATNTYTWTIYMMYGRNSGILTFIHKEKPVWEGLYSVISYTTTGQVLCSSGKLLDIDLNNGLLIH